MFFLHFSLYKHRVLWYSLLGHQCNPFKDSPVRLARKRNGTNTRTHMRLSGQRGGAFFSMKRETV